MVTVPGFRAVCPHRWRGDGADSSSGHAGSPGRSRHVCALDTGQTGRFPEARDCISASRAVCGGGGAEVTGECHRAAYGGSRMFVPFALPRTASQSPHTRLPTSLVGPRNSSPGAADPGGESTLGTLWRRRPLTAVAEPDSARLERPETRSAAHAHRGARISGRVWGSPAWWSWVCRSPSAVLCSEQDSMVILVCGSP